MRTKPSPSVAPLVLLTLFASGWATNHFVALIPVLETSGNYPQGSLEAAFGLYALGLLPSLLLGGSLADRFHPRMLTVVGAAGAIIGNLSILLIPGPVTTSVARLVVGIGVGLSISTGNAWMARLNPHGGTALAGMLLSAGFALGPFVGGLIAQLTPAGVNLTAPILVTAALSLLAIVLILRVKPVTPTQHSPAASPEVSTAVAAQERRSISLALIRSVPMAMWVFSTGSIPMVVLASRMDGSFTGPLAAGTLALVTLGTGVTVQALARKRSWGPWSGVVGSGLATIAFCVSALFGDPASLPIAIVAALMFGTVYGLCLRNGLTDVERYAPPQSRGLVGGIFYIVAYLGFGLPYLLAILLPVAGPTIPLLAVAGVAAATTLIRIVQLRQDQVTNV